MPLEPSSSKKDISPKKGFMNLSNWLIKYPKPSASPIQVNTEGSTNEGEIKNDLVPVEWYPIQSGFFTVHQNCNDSKPVRVKIGITESTADKDACTSTDNQKDEACNGFFKLGKGQYNHNLAICHSKEKDAIFFKLATCFCKATFNKHFMTMTIKPENHIEDLRGSKNSSKNSATVVCNVKFELEQTAQHFENALRKLACILRSANAPRVRIDRIGDVTPIASISSIDLNKEVNTEENNECNNEKIEDKMDTNTELPDVENNSLPSEDTGNTSPVENENIIKPDEEAKILLDLFNTFSTPYSRHIQKAVQLYLTGQNGISESLEKDVQRLINTRQADIEKYVQVLRKTNKFKNMN